MKMYLKAITVLHNQFDPQLSRGREADADTQESAELVAAALADAGYNVTSLGILPREIGKLKNIQTEVVFNLTEWTGDDASYGLRVVDELERLGLRYTGSGRKGLRITNDKVVMKQLFGKNRIPTPRWRVVEMGQRVDLAGVNFPVIVKLAQEHCGIGIDQTSVVENVVAAEKKVRQMQGQFGRSVLVEEYMPGREIQVTILERSGRPWVLPPAEVVFSARPGFRPILTYAGKWMPEAAEYVESTMAEAKLNPVETRQINRIAEICHRKFEAWDYARLDMRLDKSGQLQVLELNNNPGIDFELLSGIGVSARLAGMTFPQLVSWITENAGGRFDSRRTYATI